MNTTRGDNRQSFKTMLFVYGSSTRILYLGLMKRFPSLAVDPHCSPHLLFCESKKSYDVQWNQSLQSVFGTQVRRYGLKKMWIELLILGSKRYNNNAFDSVGRSYSSSAGPVHDRNESTTATNFDTTATANPSTVL